MPTTSTKNELQRRLRVELQYQGIDIDTYRLEDDAERELYAPATPRSIYITSMLPATMEKMQILT